MIVDVSFFFVSSGVKSARVRLDVLLKDLSKKTEERYMHTYFTVVHAVVVLKSVF